MTKLKNNGMTPNRTNVGRKDPEGLNRTKVDQIRPKWIEVDQVKPNRTKWTKDRIKPKLTE